MGEIQPDKISHKEDGYLQKKKTGDVEIHETDEEKNPYNCLVSVLIGTICKFVDQNSKLLS